MEKTKMLKVIADYDDNPVDVTAEVNFIWNIANKLRGTYQSDKYKDVIIPMTIIRRFECALVKTKDRTQEIAKIFGEGCPDEVLFKETGVGYFNLSDFTLKTLLDEPDNLEENFRSYISKFSGNVREILQSLEFDKQIAKMAKSDRLFTVMKSFSEIDLNPEKVDSIKMGYIFEDLIRRFSENAEAGDHYTGRDIVKLIVSLICAEGCEDLMQPGRVVKVLDQACGTGGMLSTSQNFILHMNPEADVYLYGQEINPESYAICKAEMLIRGQDADNIQLGDSLKSDKFEEEKTVRFVIENPPFGTAWGGKDAPEGTEEAVIRQYESSEHYEGGLPGKGDMQLLFIQRALDKINPKDGRAAIITNGSPLFTGGTTSGESQIRRWLLEHDYIEAIVALSPDSFYNTGIGTYVNILTKNKSEKRKGKIQLIDASGICHPLRKPLGMKKNEITREDREKILELYVNFEENEHCKIFDNAEFIYREYTIMQPMKRNYMITEDRIEAAKAAGCFTSLYDERKVTELNEKLENGEKLTKKEEKALEKYEAGKAVYDDLMKNLTGAVSDTVWNCRDGFMPVLKNLLPKVNGKACLDAKGLLKLAGGLSQRDENALVQTDKKGNIEYDPETKDTEIVKGTDTIEEYMAREILPHIPDAVWFFEEDAKKGTVKTGAEIPFTRYFFKYQKPETMEALEAKIMESQDEIGKDLDELFE